jgi:hypothetical protein
MTGLPGQKDPLTKYCHMNTSAKDAPEVVQLRKSLMEQERANCRKPRIPRMSSPEFDEYHDLCRKVDAAKRRGLLPSEDVDRCTHAGRGRGRGRPTVAVAPQQRQRSSPPVPGLGRRRPKTGPVAVLT